MITEELLYRQRQNEDVPNETMIRCITYGAPPTYSCPNNYKNPNIFSMKNHNDCVRKIYRINVNNYISFLKIIHNNVILHMLQVRGVPGPAHDVQPHPDGAPHHARPRQPRRHQDQPAAGRGRTRGGGRGGRPGHQDRGHTVDTFSVAYCTSKTEIISLNSLLVGNSIHRLLVVLPERRKTYK